MTSEHAPPSADEASAVPGLAPPAPAPSLVRRILPPLIVLTLLGGGVAYYLHARHLEDTDDAQIDGEITNLSPRVAGTISAILVSDHQVVKAGDTLAEIDPTDFEVALALAKASLAQAEALSQAETSSVSMTESTNLSAVSSGEADVSSAESGIVAADRDVRQLTAQLEQAKATALNAQHEKDRAEKLVATGAVSTAEQDTRTNLAAAANANVAAVTAALAAAQARYGQMQARVTSARARITEVRANGPRQLDVRKANVGAREAMIAAARAQVRQAELNLGYTKIVAPTSGIVGRKAMSLGDHVAPGQSVAAIARVDDLWVTANFRETQLRDLRPGQASTVYVDALAIHLRGSVESIGGATGSRFSLFPPENAAGNYVKVVQRVPVRIHLDPGQPGMDLLRPGMSVEPEVRVR